MRKISSKDILSLHEIKRLLASVDMSTVRGVRDKAMIELLISTGMWVSELVNLRVVDVLFDEMVIIVNGRDVPLNSRTYRALDFYIESAGPQDALFVSFNRGNFAQSPLTRQGAWKIIRQYKELAGIKKALSPEMIRNSFAVHFLRDGGELQKLQEILGHKDIESTAVFQNIKL